MRAAFCVLLVMALVTGCTSAARAAAQRFAHQVGRSADDAEDIEAAFRRTLQGSTDEQITDAITSATSRTQWMDDVAAAAARQQEEELRTLRTVASSTCTIVDLAEDYQEAGIDGITEDEVLGIIAGQLSAAGLPETEEKVNEIWTGIESQLRSLEQTGSIDWAGAWFDLGCFASS